MKNFTDAPKSTVIAIVVFVTLSVMKVAGKLENEAYIPLATLSVTAMVTDPLQERKRGE